MSPFPLLGAPAALLQQAPAARRSLRVRPPRRQAFGGGLGSERPCPRAGVRTAQNQARTPPLHSAPPGIGIGVPIPVTSLTVAHVFLDLAVISFLLFHRNSFHKCYDPTLPANIYF